jgi:hypothetical protein
MAEPAREDGNKAPGYLVQAPVAALSYLGASASPPLLRQGCRAGLHAAGAVPRARSAQAHKQATLGLGYLSIGGGIALGLVGVALTLANPRGVGWGMGIVVIGGVLFLVFVWPTPYKYYRVKDHQKEQRLIRVHRVTGDADYVPKSRAPAAAAASASQN